MQEHLHEHRCRLYLSYNQYSASLTSTSPLAATVSFTLTHRFFFMALGLLHLHLRWSHIHLSPIASITIFYSHHTIEMTLACIHYHTSIISIAIISLHLCILAMILFVGITAILPLTNIVPRYASLSICLTRTHSFPIIYLYH